MSNRKITQTKNRKQLRQIKNVSLVDFTNGTIATSVDLGESELIILETPNNKPLTKSQIAEKYKRYLSS